MIYHLLHFFYWKVFKMDKTRNPQSKRPTFIFGNCMYVTGVHRLVEMVVTLRISAAPDGIRQINDVSPRQGSLANPL